MRLPWGKRLSNERTSLLTAHLLAVALALACWASLPESREHISLFTKAVPVLGTVPGRLSLLEWRMGGCTDRCVDRRVHA